MKKEKLLSFLFLFALVIGGFSQEMPNDWFTDEVNPGQDLHLFQDTEMVYEGDLSCKMVLLNGVAADVPYLFSFNYNVTAGSEYTFTLWYMDNDNRGELKVYADFYDSEGEDVYGEDPQFSEDGENWQSITWTSVVPENAVEGYVWIKFYPIEENFDTEAVIYVDAAEFNVGGFNLVSNGSFESWDGVGFEENPGSAAVLAYPNPFSEQVQLSGVEYDRIRVTNLVGQVVFDKELSNTHPIDLGFLNNGTYFLSAYVGKQRIQTVKLMKQ
jgi:hypothetical protein